MKHKFKYIIILTALSLFICCKKENYRDKYIGNWDFVVIVSKHNIDSIGQYEEDTIYYLGQISYGNTENEINIQYTKDNSIILNIDESGALSGFPSPQYSSGKFDGFDKIHLYLRWGGLGGSLTHSINGVKK